MSEQLKRFNDEMSKAVSRSKELAKAQSNNRWLQVSALLESVMQKANILARMKSLTQQQSNNIVDAYEGKLRTKEEAKEAAIKRDGHTLILEDGSTKFISGEGNA